LLRLVFSSDVGSSILRFLELVEPDSSIFVFVSDLLGVASMVTVVVLVVLSVELVSGFGAFLAFGVLGFGFF